ncbi:MAG: tRNA (adenosine(37)-N6)-dimethylallyltransferase MiaA [Patescibacteria group bacterium]|nr:tRNA (adenosine(37)-N6)-dimethylallyltransferase MiaA [Patescibacteria group bacterium]
MNKLLVICGPTATGKTSLAHEIAQEFNGELICADSRQVYKGMDIGTGKDIDNVHLYGVVNPDEDFSVSHFVRFAIPIIDGLHKRKNLPIIVGGTGLYIKALVEGIDTIHIPRNEILRKELEQLSIHDLQQSLPTSVLETMNDSDRNNPRRLIRKIEIFNSQFKINRTHPKYDVLVIGLLASVSLHQRVRDRVNKRLEQGILKEIQRLIQRGYDWNLPSMSSFGYKEWREYFDHPTEEAKRQAVENWISHEITYAKKQMVWFKKQRYIRWFDIDQSAYKDAIQEMISVWYTKI